MSLKEFENRAREIFSNDRETVDTKAILEGIRKKRRRRWFAFYIPLFVLLASACVYLIYAVEDLNDKNVLSEIQEQETHSDMETEVRDKNSDNTNGKSPFDLKEESNVLSKSGFQENSILRDHPTKKTEAATENGPNSRSGDLRQSGSAIHENEVENVSKQNVYVNKMPDDTPAGNQQSHEMGPDSESDFLPGMIDQDAHRLNSLQKREKKENITQYPSLLQLPLLESNSLPGNTGDYPIRVECPSIKESGIWQWTFSLEAGPLIPHKKFDLLSSEPSGPLEKRKTSEKALTGFSSLMALQVQKSNFPLYLRIGGRFSTFQEQLTLREQFTQLDTIHGLISMTTSANGDTVTAIYGDIVQETTITREGKVHYRLSTWDLPISLGIEKRWGNWAVSAEAGTQLNLALQSGGRILSPDDEFVSLERAETFRSSLGASFFGGLAVHRSLGLRTRVRCSIASIFYSDSFSAANQEFDQGYTLWNLGLGIDYRL